MNKYFTTRSIRRPQNIGDTRTVVYCDNNRESIAKVRKRFPDAMPITRNDALVLVRQERSIYRKHYGCTPEYPHTAYIYPYWWEIGRAIDATVATDSTGCIIIM